METKDILKEIDKLGLSEKIILVEDIWDSIAKSNAALTMPEWHKRELKRRYEDFKAGKLALEDWSDVHKGLRNKFK